MRRHLAPLGAPLHLRRSRCTTTLAAAAASSERSIRGRVGRRAWRELHAARRTRRKHITSQGQARSSRASASAA
ncbi:hypothetical protein FA09DRAFT_329100 [Tilletiopsis washingtonensis]|uniref:Uncharacterized protein n=1 Tax=Tilletiopsis washingtonensis TaxID=58919 RepID=A0A316ZCA6_9BASI|nr:hypothetical protein FA09DRAFT_329100 [Tilletiopsis washingtonensis]PWN99159.1 hypothetical protein FA09DRAFT_329100 [Tilletiopsis washingtonensis]